jgi:hypothetical protein
MTAACGGSTDEAAATTTTGTTGTITVAPTTTAATTTAPATTTATTTRGTTTAGTTTDDGEDGSTGPPEPGTPLVIIDGDCGQVADEMSAIIEKSPSDAEAHAFRALAKLCLGEDASGDLAVARAREEELSPEARADLNAVRKANLPRGDELRDVLRDAVRKQAPP